MYFFYAYFRFDHYYKCVEGQTSPANSWHDNCQVDFPNSNITGGCCAYTPKVQVLDNWGWCNGVCDDGIPTTPDENDTSAGGVGCYNREESGDLECNALNSAYTFFGGQVLVPPTE